MLMVFALDGRTVGDFTTPFGLPVTSKLSIVNTFILVKPKTLVLKL
jgi:hypothetical protein